MIRTTGIYYIGIPVDDLDRAECFYTQVLGMKVEGRAVYFFDTEGNLQRLHASK